MSPSGAAHGVLVMAYGSPAGESTDELAAYYTDIRRGRPPSPEQLADLGRRYAAIGGVSPLAERTRAQAAALAAALGDGWRVELGLKHASPSVEHGARALVDAGVDDVVGLVLAPHASALSTGTYHERAASVVGADRYRPVGAWGGSPALADLLAARVREAMARMGEPGGPVEVVVTAHSLPTRVLDLDRPTYVEQLEETARNVAASAGLASVRIAWQSAGRTPDPWLGPDLLSVIRTLAAEGFRGVVVCPAGFTSDHLEVLYDVDVEARAVADAVGVRLERTQSLNDDPAFVAVLRDLVVGAAGG